MTSLRKKSFQLVHVSWLGLRGSCLEAVAQPRNLSHQVFIAASCREGCLNYLGEIMHGVWAILDRHPAHFATVWWRLPCLKKMMEEGGGGNALMDVHRHKN